jgi:3-hydroxyacyl-[acyl-carrier-protein] dehydratase
MSRAAIERAIPHRDPFLLLDEIVEQDGERIVCRKYFSGSEDFFRGHYPHFPLVPGVLLCEAAMQAGAVLLAPRVAEAARGRDHHAGHGPAATRPAALVPVATRMNQVQFKRMVRPGETIEVEVRLLAQAGAAYELSARVSCQGQLAARLDFVCMLVER